MRITFRSYRVKHNESVHIKRKSPTIRSGLLVNGIRKLRTPEDSGLGDTLERLIAKFGGNKFKQIAKRLGVNCGCEDRQKYLNKRYPYQTE